MAGRHQLTTEERSRGGYRRAEKLRQDRERAAQLADERLAALIETRASLGPRRAKRAERRRAPAACRAELIQGQPTTLHTARLEILWPLPQRAG